jgi:O-antigen ligase
MGKKRSNQSTVASHQSSVSPATGHPSLTGSILLVHLVLSPLLFSRLTADAFELPKVFLLALTSLGLVAWLLPDVRRLAAPIARDPVCWGFLLWLLSAALSTATSVSPLTSLRGAEDSHAGLLTVAVYTLHFFVTRHLSPTPAHGRWLMAGPVVAMAVASAYALVQAGGADPVGWHGTSSVGGFVRPFGSMGHPNHLAAFLVMALPLALYFAVAAARRGNAWATTLLGLVALLAVATVVMSLSRAAWLALGLVGAVLGVGWWKMMGDKGSSGFPPVGGLVGARPPDRVPAVDRRSPLPESGRPSVGPGARSGDRAPTSFWLLVASFVLLASCTLLFLLTTSGVVGERLRGLIDLGGRRHIWEASDRVFLDHPLLGCGTDALGVTFSRYRSPDYWRVEWDTNATKAHNEVLHLLATQGLVGLAAAAFLAFALTNAGLRAWRRAAPDECRLLLAVFAGLAGAGALGLFGFTSAPCGVLLVTWAAMLSAWSTHNPDAKTILQPWPMPALAVAGALVALIFVHNFYPPEAQTGEPFGALVVVALAFAGACAGISGAGAWDGGRSQPAGVHPVRFGWPMAVRVVGGTVVLGVGLCWALPCLKASWLCRQATALPNDDAGVLPLLEAAVQSDPTWPPYRVTLAAHAHRAYGRSTDPETRRLLLVQAQGSLEAAIRLVPARASHHADLGRVLANRVRERHSVSAADALAAFERALDADAANPFLYVDAGKLAAEVEDLPRADGLVKAGLALYPNHAPLQALAGWLELMQGRLDSGKRMLENATRADWHGDEAARDELLSFLASLPRSMPSPSVP